MTKQSPPRVLFLGGIFAGNSPARTLAERLLYAVADAAERRGQTIELLVPRAGLLERIPNSVLEVVVWKHTRRPLLWEQWAVPEYVNEKTDSVLYTMGSPIPAMLRIPAFTTLNGKYDVPEGRMASWITRRLHERTLRRAKALHFFSQEDAETARLRAPELPPTRTRLIPQGIDQDLFSMRALTKEERAEYKMLRDAGLAEPFVLQVGQADAKELRVLLAAFKRLAGQHKKGQLVLTSDAAAEPEPKLARALEAIPEGRVFRLRDVVRKDLAYLYQKAAYAIFTSKCTPRDAMEAQATGCPLLCPEEERFAGVLDSSALYFSANSPRDLLENMEQMQEAELRNWYKMMAISNAVEFSWESVGERWLDLAEEVFTAHA